MKPQLSEQPASWVSGRVLTSEVPPLAHLDVAKRWLHACQSKHDACKSGSQKLPPRIVHVGKDGQDPRLEAGLEGTIVSFATLSHCWGGISSTAVTTKENFKDHEIAISMDLLPKTFREAIIVCRHLDIPYLWIDSLCIIQDDKDDWRRHSGLMGDIYLNSTLTIAAADSYNSSMGLFIPQRPYDYCYSDIITLPQSFSCGKGTAYITAASWGVYGPPGTDVEVSVLQSRAWVMQERGLARRTLHFLTGQMVWECCEKMRGQNGFAETRKAHSMHARLRNHLRVMTEAFEQAWNFDEADYWCDEEEEEEEEQEEPKDTVECARSERAGEEDIGTTQQHECVEQRVVSGSLDGPGMAADLSELAMVDNNASNRDDRSSPSDESDHAFLAILIDHPKKGRASQIVDLRHPSFRPVNSQPPSIISRQIDNALYNFLDVATRQTIHHLWYTAVASYSTRRLTFSSDKLPALAGIASRVQAITHDEYLAGHFRRELERSLFWKIDLEPSSCTPLRLRDYRGPSWSWPSVEGQVIWDFPDISPGMDEAAPIEILSAQVRVEKEESPLGSVVGGEIVIRARTIRAVWDSEKQAWTISTSPPLKEFEESRPPHLRIITTNGTKFGEWTYDDMLNGLLPGRHLTPISTDEEVYTRRVPCYYYMPTNTYNISFHGKDFMELPVWRRGTYVPEQLVFVKGATRRVKADWDEDEDRWGDDISQVEVLVLAKMGDGSGKYRRVGVGKVAHWHDEDGCVEVLTVV